VGGGEVDAGAVVGEGAVGGAGGGDGAEGEPEGVLFGGDEEAVHAVGEMDGRMAEEVGADGEAPGVSPEKVEERRVSDVSACFGQFLFATEFAEVVGGEDEVVAGSRAAHGEGVGCVFDDDGARRGAGLGDEEVVRVGSGCGLDELERFVACGAALDEKPERERVRLAATAIDEGVDVKRSHGESFEIDGGECSAEAGPSDGYEGDAAVGFLEEDDLRVVGDAHGEEFEVPGEDESAVAGCCVPCGVAGAGDGLGAFEEGVADEDVVVRDFGAFGDAAHFFDEMWGDEWLGEARVPQKFFAAESAEAVERGDVVAEKGADEGPEKPAVLEAHLAGRAFEVEEAPAAMDGEAATAFAPATVEGACEFGAGAGDSGVDGEGVFE